MNTTPVITTDASIKYITDSSSDATPQLLSFLYYGDKQVTRYSPNSNSSHQQSNSDKNHTTTSTSENRTTLKNTNKRTLALSSSSPLPTYSHLQTTAQRPKLGRWVLHRPKSDLRDQRILRMINW